MTTLAKVEANQRNGEQSTGPRTVEGKAVVARNATKHGIFSNVPVIPGECPEAWEAHRVGVVDSLEPVGLLEVNLAERAALLLWRLQRLARYEAETVTAGMEDEEVPPLPPPEEEEDAFSDPPPKQKTRDEQLRDTRRELRATREELARVVPARDFLRSPPESELETAVPPAVAESIFETAFDHVMTIASRSADPPEFGSKPFLRKLRQKGSDVASGDWTPEVIGHGLAIYAACAREAGERFFETVSAELEGRAEELTRKVRRLEVEAEAITRLLDGRTARKQAAKLLPGDGRDERIAKYERHLHNLLTSTLHELERFQARREGEAVPPPAVADVNVTINGGAE